MPAATFGDFLTQAEEHLRAAIASVDRADLDHGAVGELRRVVAGLARYLDDLAPGDVIETMAQAGLSPWGRAAVDARAVLHQADTYLAEAMATIDGPESGPTGGPSRHLVAVAASLTAGRDLLHTHLTTTPDSLRVWRSEWAPVLTSPPITRALTGQIARWARRLAPLTASLASASPGRSPASVATRDDLRAAAQWLDAASTATRAAQAADPVTADDLRLLYAIPAAQAPPRLPPRDAETVAELCAGITVSAQRLRAAVFAAADDARGSPAVDADAWRWITRAAAVTGHTSELVLRALASPPSPASLRPGRSQLNAAADAVGRAWQAWRQVSLTWNDLTTEPHSRPPPAAIEISDLMLRVGRLAHDDPQWTPARTRGSRMRDPSGLATNGPDVIASVHEAADALARLATADLNAVGLAARAGRLYVPTRTLPERFNVPRPYAPAPPDRPKPLLAAYRAAHDSSLHAADALASLAIAAGAPSSVLALARAAVTPQPDGHLAEQDRQHMAAAAPGNRPDNGGATLGPVQHAVRSLRISDPILLLRAAAIDTAAQTLITQAEQMSGQRPRSPGNGSAAPGRSHPGDAARLAAKDNLPLTGQRLTAAEASNPSQVRSPQHRARRAVRTPCW